MKILIICSLLILPQNSEASLITTETFLAHQTSNSPRNRLIQLLQKKEVLKKLKEFGVSPSEAKERLTSMSEVEIENLNSQIDQLPAGADAAGSIIGTALAVFVILLITDILCWTKVFNFTRCASR